MLLLLLESIYVALETEMHSVPIQLITLWHPEHWLDSAKKWENPAIELRRLPHIAVSRAEKELRRIEAAKQAGRDGVYETLHGGRIFNTGRKEHEFRRTWISQPARFIQCCRGLKPRLLYTDENRPAARWKVEFRYDWGEEANCLPMEVVRQLYDGMSAATRISVRQLWLNPTGARFGKLQIPETVLQQEWMANLHIGPFDSKDGLRPAKLEFAQREGVWWLDYEAGPESPLRWLKGV